MGKDAAAEANCNDQNCEGRMLVNPQGISTSSKGTSSYKLDLAGAGKNASSSWLSLESRRPGSCTPNNDGGTTGRNECSVDKDVASFSSTRYSKKIAPSTKRIPMQKPDVAEQLSLGSLSFPSTKKPRKRQ